MMKDISLGQYYPADSLLHRLDPRIKLLATILYLVAAFPPKAIGAFCSLSGSRSF